MSYGRVESEYSSPYGGDVAEENTFASVSPAGFLDRLEKAYKIAPVTESPIETILGAALVLACEHYLGDLFAYCPGREKVPVGKLLLIPQYKWRRYRIDWAFVFDGKPVLFVECDGQDFHGSEEQIRRDQRRDADIRSAGLEVIRFTGSAINTNEDACAGLVLASVLRRLR